MSVEVILPQPPPKNHLSVAYSAAHLAHQAADKQSLGIVAKIASTSENKLKSPHELRFHLQELAAELLPDSRVSQCLRQFAPVNPEAGAVAYRYNTVSVMYSEKQGKAYYQNLIVCNRIWDCAVCAARITEQRRKELTHAANRSDFSKLLVTFTLRHHRGDHLKTVLDALLASYRRLKSGRFWQDLKLDFSWAGDVRSLEVTHGDNGWHPHVHALMFFEGQLDGHQVEILRNRLKRRWSQVLAKSGFDATWEHGVDVRAGDNYAQEYIAKFGREPVADLDSRWTVEHELTKAPVKRAKLGGRTPTQLLYDYGEGDKQAGRLFQEYASVFKGHNQLVWSRGFRALLGMDEIEAEAQQIESQAVELVELSADEWQDIKANHARGKLLEVASAGDAGQVWDFIATLKPTQRGVIGAPGLLPGQRAGWRLQPRK